jgi:hypothetical protein
MRVRGWGLDTTAPSVRIHNLIDGAGFLRAMKDGFLGTMKDL